MPRRLPTDLTYTILSFLPLSYTTRFTLTDAVWEFRYRTHYGYTDNANKKLYLLRAATEQHEVCADTFGLYSNHNYVDLISYYAARSSNWNLVRIAAINDLLTEILTDAIADNQIKVVQTILNLEYTGRRRGYVNFDDGYVGDKTLRLSNNMIDVLLTHFTRLPNDIKAQVIAQMSLDDYKKFILGLPTHQLWDIVATIFRSYKYNPNIKHKLEVLYFGYISGQKVEIDETLFYNRAYQANNEDRQLKVVLWLAPNSLGDWLVHLNDDINRELFHILKEHYSYIPNAKTRAMETIKILEQYVEQNPTILLSYIGYIKLVAGIFEVDDVDYIGEINNDSLITLLDNKQFDVIRQLDEVERVTLCLQEYTFNDVDALMCIVNCKNILIDKSCSWIRIFTLPLLVSLLQKPDDIDEELIAEAEQYIPDCQTLAKGLIA